MEVEELIEKKEAQRIPTNDGGRLYVFWAI